MTAIPNPFGGPDPMRVDAIAKEIGAGFIAGYAPIAQRHIFDPTLPGSILIAAIGKAHAAGLAKIVAGLPADGRRQLIADIAAWIDAEVTGI